jgi:tellurite resistance protein
VPDEMGRTSALRDGFANVEKVIADPLRFKARLNIGEDAYASLRLKKNLFSLWDVASWGGTGAAVASSKVVAGTFFAPTGLLALLGLGTAVTPIGWVIAAAVGSAGAYYGVTRLFGGYEGSRVETIPKFINTPIDLLGATLLDLMGSLAIRVAAIDGQIDDRERAAISEQFVSDWGFDPAYVEQALVVLEANTAAASIKALSAQLARFQIENPDCNADAMRAALLEFLRDIATADGVLDEREELALDAVAAAMADATPGVIARAQENLSWAWTSAAGAVGDLASRAGAMDFASLNPFKGDIPVKGRDDRERS